MGVVGGILSADPEKTWVILNLMKECAKAPGKFFEHFFVFKNNLYKIKEVHPSWPLP